MFATIVCTPMYRTRPAFFSSFRAARSAGSAAAGSMTRSILGTLSLASNDSMCVFTRVGLRRGGCRGGPSRRPEELVLNPELVGSRDVELLRCRAAVHRVEDSAAAVGKRLEDLLERGVIRAPRVVAERESEGREHLTGRRNGPLNELSARLLQVRGAAPA